MENQLITCGRKKNKKKKEKENMKKTKEKKKINSKRFPMVYSEQFQSSFRVVH